MRTDSLSFGAAVSRRTNFYCNIRWVSLYSQARWNVLPQILDLLNSSYPTQPHSLIAKYFMHAEMQI